MVLAAKSYLAPLNLTPRFSGNLAGLNQCKRKSKNTQKQASLRSPLPGSVSAQTQTYTCKSHAKTAVY